MSPSGGHYRFRAVAIGYRPTPFAEITLEPADTTIGDVRMSHATMTLPDLVAMARPTLAWSSHYYRLWDAPTGNVVAVVAYSLYYRNLLATGIGSTRTGSVLLALHQGNARASHVSDTTEYLQLRAPADSTAATTYSGMFVAPSSIDFTDWTLIVTQPEREAGGDWEFAKPALLNGPMALSDLVVGATEQHVEWNNHGDRVVLSGQEPIDVSGAIQLYYQVKSDLNRPDIHTDVAVYHVDKGVKTPNPVLHLSFNGAFATGLNAVHHALDLSRVNPGRYRIELQLTDRTIGTTAKQSVTIYLQ